MGLMSWSRGIALSSLCALSAAAYSAPPTPMEGDYVVPEFHFGSGETLKDLRLHYTTYGSRRRDAAGHVNNAVLIMHGTSGSGQQFVSDKFAGVLFGPSQLLDAGR